MNRSKIIWKMGRSLVYFSALLIFVFCSVHGVLARPNTKAKHKPAVVKTHVINIRNYEFSPATLTVNVGDTVVWKNGDVTPHTATGKGFNSGSIEAGGSWSFTAKKKGSFGYICTFHPTMKGKLIVK